MSLTTTKYVMAMLTKMMMITTLMRTFEWDSLPIGGDNSGLLKHICCCASDLVPVTGQVLMIILSLDSFLGSYGHHPKRMIIIVIWMGQQWVERNPILRLILREWLFHPIKDFQIFAQCSRGRKLLLFRDNCGIDDDDFDDNDDLQENIVQT